MHFSDPDYRESLELLARIRAVSQQVREGLNTPEELLQAATDLLAAAERLKRVSRRVADRGNDPPPRNNYAV